MTDRLFVVVLLVAVSGCATPNVLLVHPRSGDMVECSAVGYGVRAALALMIPSQRREAAVIPVASEVSSV